MAKDGLVISTSLNPDSRSHILARQAYEAWKDSADVALIDLREYSLPLCDGDVCYSNPEVVKLTAQVKEAAAILLAVPIYNYASSASAKNLIELTGHAWNDKVVGFLCAAGGKSSYMSILGIANSLMLDFRCLINPRFVYADGSAFEADEISDREIGERIRALVASTSALSGRLSAHV